ncbi:MAG: 5'/3'-nucleotidase SurE [Candidatus Parvarchaeum sp.]|nr:5'/3'-nucleotidase SurE [Candidatus Parvarchaeota archaeon]MCL5976118.1 5'/3'-nucleotidase SurE [Candidatus Parvarchaeota archaeon]MCW1294491.1 5'/3'-nucleotidase SurE [Candidatus Parvarchaeum tengchongense]MCW1295888.1 5'/3'-nucleotidase SurE [Candidatus Parvarchaeum tengchongense]MCW1299129.1 5'/3'-nucleotidase SurE [Candidatus Parvarchaeum tengchongense]
MVVLVTNDDGYKTEGLHTLYRAAKKVFGPEVMVVSPDKLQSSSGMSFTFHKPLRVEKITYNGMPCYTVSGTPADCVFMSIYHLFKRKVSMVLSGINEGMNAGLETVYSSGTISAAMFAAISEIPSIAFSKNLSPEMDQNQIDKSMNDSYENVVKILKSIKTKGFPKNIDMININLPLKISKETEIKIVKTDKRVFDDVVIKKKDPNGRDYYWLYGTLRKDLDKNADLYNLFDGKITVTPIKLSTVEETHLKTLSNIFT